MYSDQSESSVFVAKRNEYVFKWDLDDDCDGAHLASFGMESWIECCEKVMAFSVACQRHRMVQYCYESGITNKQFYMCLLLCLEAKEVI